MNEDLNAKHRVCVTHTCAHQAERVVRVAKSRAQGSLVVKPRQHYWSVQRVIKPKIINSVTGKPKALHRKQKVYADTQSAPAPAAKKGSIVRSLL